MINELEYRTEDRFGVVHVLSADKNVRQKNAWHLASINGNALPPISTLGAATYGLPGKGYHGTHVEAREIEASIYADGLDQGGLRNMLNEVPFILSANDDKLGLLRLTNDAGDMFRIKAKCTDFAPEKQWRRSVLFGAVFDCPYPYFESETLYRVPLVAVSGGKVFPLERPYTFGNVSETGSTSYTINCFNPGDAAAPCVVKLYGSGLSYVDIYNYANKKAMRAQNMSVSSIEISTDPDNCYAIVNDSGEDASAYLDPSEPLSEFVLEPGYNRVYVSMTATSVQTAGACIEWRGRYSVCL